MPSAFIYNQTTKMKKKRITYGVYGMMEYQDRQSHTQSIVH